MSRVDVVRQCWNSRHACGKNGHGDHVFALREWRNGTLHVYEVCNTCGHSFTSSGLKRKDHPEWESYPRNPDAPQSYHDGCRCGRCVKDWGEQQLVQKERTAMAQIRASNATEWGQTGARLRDQRNARMSWSEYRIYRKTEAWRDLRSQVMERFDGRCAACNCTENLHVHHRTYERVGQEDIGDLTLLCMTCHQLLHSTWNALEVVDTAYCGPEIRTADAS